MASELLGIARDRIALDTRHRDAGLGQQHPLLVLVPRRGRRRDRIAAQPKLFGDNRRDHGGVVVHAHDPVNRKFARERPRLSGRACRIGEIKGN